MKKSFEFGFGILLAVAGFLATGIAQTEIRPRWYFSRLCLNQATCNGGEPDGGTRMPRQWNL